MPLPFDTHGITHSYIKHPICCYIQIGERITSNLVLYIYLFIQKGTPSDIFGSVVDHQFLLLEFPNHKPM